MQKNLIARNYKRFTFDLVLRDFGFYFENRRWKFFLFDDEPVERTIELQLGFLDFTVWIKSRR